MALSSSGPDDHIAQLVQLTERLTSLIAEETRAFEALKPHEAAPFVEETSKLANLYRLESHRLKENPAVVEGASLKARLALKQATEAFEAVLARHGRAIEAAKTVTEGLVKAIAEEIDSKRPKGGGYGPGAKKAATTAAPIALNRKA